MNKNEILRNQKAAFLLLYISSSCHIQSQHKHYSIHGGNCQGQPCCTGDWGHDSFLLEFTVKLWAYTAMKGRTSLWMKGGKKVIQESWWVRRSFESTQSLVQLPSLLWRLPPGPGQWGSPSWGGTEACSFPSVTVATPVGCLTFQISMSHLSSLTINFQN